MLTYVVHHKIDTLLELWEPFDFNGFSFSAWSVDYQAGRQDGWLVEKAIEADTVEEAYRLFSLQFFPLVDRIAFIGQCHTTAELETFIITKPNDNRFFWRYAKKRGTVSLHFSGDEVQSLAALDQYEEKGDVFRYLREATNATSFYTMHVMLVSALEAMAGTTDETGRRKANREYIANKILKDKQLCDRLFKYKEGIRNQILHGGFVDHGMHGGTNYNSIVYNAIINHFNDCYGLKIRETAKGVPRTITGSYDVWWHWCEWVKDDTRISLQLLNQKFDAADGHEYYTMIDEPDDF